MPSESEANSLANSSDRSASSTSLKTLYSLGHSNLEFAQFAKLLKDHEIALLADVRSVPQSSRFPQFSQPGFENLLKVEGIPYLFLGEELGGRPDDMENDQVLFRPE